MAHDIRNNEQQSQYETTIDGHTGFTAYRLETPDRIVFTHTIVPPQLEGRGVASAIVKYALEDARAKHWKVVAECPYVASFIARRPEYQDLVA